MSERKSLWADDSYDSPNLKAGYTFFAQFLFHDLTYELVRRLSTERSPNTVQDGPASLRLHSLYGPGPEMAPHLYAFYDKGYFSGRLLDAPASLSVVSTEQIQDEPALTTMDHVEGQAGVDVMRSGLQGGYVVVRGFNNVFSGSLLTLTDNRIARVPSLRANIQHLNPSTNLDVERVEIVRGPASALYGPNAANGVMHVITRSPIDDPGSAVALGGGLRQQDGHAPKLAGRQQARRGDGRDPARGAMQGEVHGGALRCCRAPPRPAPPP